MKRWIFFVLSFLVPSYLFAATFELSINANNQITQQSFSSIDALFDSAEEEAFQSLIPDYQAGKTAVTAIFNARDILAISSYAENSSSLEFKVDALGIAKEFDGGTRKKSSELLRNYITNNGDGILTQLLEAGVETTGIDLAAGNPDSLMGSMVSSDFNSASAANKSNSQGESGSSSQVEVSVSAGRSTIDGHDKSVLTMPLSYTYYFAQAGYQLRINAPLSYVEIDGSKAYKASIGAALRIPISENFSITPAFRTGIVTSNDMGTASNTNSLSLISIYNQKWNKINLSFANMVGIIKTQGLSANNVDIDYSLSNQVLKNGVSIELPSAISLAGKKISWSASLANTRFTGSKMYIDHYNDFAFSLGTLKNNNDSLRLGLTYTKGPKGYSSSMLNFGYKF
jgi:hypothetical protein